VYCVVYILPAKLKDMEDSSSECPFCGGLNIYLAEYELDLGWGILCLDCQASGPQSETKELAYSLWHQRWTPDYDVNGNTVKAVILAN